MTMHIYIGFYIAVTTVIACECRRKGCRFLAWDTPLFLAAMFVLWPFALAMHVDRARRNVS